MKKSHKFISACLAVTALFCVITAIITAAGIENIRKTSNDTVNRLVSAISEKYPDVSEKEIAEILNEKSVYPDNTEIPAKYGINPDKDWISFGNQGSYRYIIISAVVCIAFGSAFVVIFILYIKA